MITLGPSTHSSQTANKSVAPKILNVEEEFPDFVYSKEDLLKFHRPTSWLHPSFTVIPYITTVESLEPVSYQPFDIDQIQAAADAALAAKPTFRGGPAQRGGRPQNPSYRNEKGAWPPRRAEDDEGSERKFDRNLRGSGGKGDDLPEWASQNVDDILSGHYEPGSVIGQIPDKNQWKRDGPRRGQHSMYDDFAGDDDLDHGQLPGVLIYVKNSLTGDEPADVQNYSETHPHFPHQKTDLRQAFDEAQFESYRALGDHVARAVFGDAVEELDDDRALWTEESPHNEFVRGNRRLFAAVLDRWSDQSPESSNVQIEASRAWIDVHRELRLDPALARLSRELYPEQATAADLVENDVDPARRRRAELHAVAQMLQIMEDAWYRLGIRGYQGRPVNQGWMNVFARWASARSFHRLWPTLRPEFSREFVQFCEARLHLASATPRIERLAAVDLDQLRAHTDPIALRARFPDDPRADESAILALAGEFALDWPTEVAAGRDVVTLVARSEEFRVALRDVRAADGVSNGLDRPLIWLAWLGPEAPRADSKRFACGIVLARADDLDPKIVRLFAWIRPVHRSLGLGARFLEAVLADLKPHIDGRRLRIRYPAWPHSDATESFRVGWRAFFGLYDFRDLSGEANPDDPDVDLILDRQF